MTAKHSVLTRANGVRLPADPRDPGSANGRPLRSERSCRGRVGVARLRRATPGCPTPRPGTRELGDWLMAGRQALTLFVEVRVLAPERSRCVTKALFDNRIVDDARGRAPPRPQRCPCSQSGDGACLKRRRCWFDSRRGHYQGWNPQGFHASRDGLRETSLATPTQYRGTQSFRPLVRDRTARRRLSACQAVCPDSGWSSGR